MCHVLQSSWHQEASVPQVWAAKQAVAAGTLSAQRFADAPAIPADVDEEGLEGQEAAAEEVRPELRPQLLVDCLMLPPRALLLRPAPLRRAHPPLLAPAAAGRQWIVADASTQRRVQWGLIEM